MRLDGLPDKGDLYDWIEDRKGDPHAAHEELRGIIDDTVPTDLDEVQEASEAKVIVDVTDPHRQASVYLNRYGVTGQPKKLWYYRQQFWRYQGRRL